MFKFSKFNTAVNWNDTCVSPLQSLKVIVVYDDYYKFQQHPSFASYHQQPAFSKHYNVMV